MAIVWRLRSGVVEAFDDERAEQEGADGADDADDQHELHQPGEAGAELGDLVARRQA